MRIQQKKSLGQVFLKAEWPAQRTVEQLKDWGVRRVLEIGPGSGALTKPLAEAGFDVTAVETDQRFAEMLRPSLGPTLAEKVQVAHADFLEFSVDEWIGPESAIVGNIPYHISTPIVLKLLETLPRLQGVVLLTQLEFAQRLASPCGSKDYGSISVFCQLRAEVAMLDRVERHLFSPVPNVDSALLSMRAKHQALKPELLRKAEIICRQAFSQRRKKLSNSIKAFLKDKDLTASPVSLDLRPERLAPEDFLLLARYLFPEIN